MTAVTKAEAKEIAKDAVREVLTEFGIDHEKPIEHQKDMAWVRASRVNTERLSFRVVLLLVGIVIIGGAAMLWAGLLSKFGQ